MRVWGEKTIRALGLLSAVALSHCASSVPLTTEFQARSSDRTKVQKASEIFQLKNKKFNPIHYQIFDSNGIFASNKIVARYRDKGNNVDFTLKLRFDYNESMLKVLSQCFIDQKVEINRYSDQPNPVIELAFQRSYKKEDMGMEKTKALSEAQILEQFENLQNNIKMQTALLAEQNPEFFDHFEDFTDGAKKNFEIVSKKINLVSNSNVSTWKKTSTFQRDRWSIGAWKTYPEVVIEVTHSDQPSMEISTRLEGDIADKSFFGDLRLSGLQI